MADLRLRHLERKRIRDEQLAAQKAAREGNSQLAAYAAGTGKPPTDPATFGVGGIDESILKGLRDGTLIVVAKEPTMAMRQAACDRIAEAQKQGWAGCDPLEIYRVMIAAATSHNAAVLAIVDDRESASWTPRIDAVIAVAKRMAEHLTGKPPTEEVTVQAAQFLWNCIDRGALSPLAARQPRKET